MRKILIDEATMKLALEALEGIHPGNMTPMAEEYWNKAITALREALEQPAQQQERINNELSMREPSAIRDRLIQAGWTPPAQQPAQEPVAWISHNAGLYHFKPDQSLDPLPLYLAPPPQRTWVELTPEEVHSAANEELSPKSFARGAAWANAKLMEKNK